MINEELDNLYYVEVIMKSDFSFNKTDIVNQIRAIENVVVITPVDVERLNRLSNERFEYSFLKMKFIAKGKSAKKELSNIKNHSLGLEGVIHFKPIMVSFAKH